ncbi:MAG TPA: hypothetical protein VF957_19655 [Bradyrhizobium sp.]
MLDRPGIIAQSTRQVAAAHAALAMLMIAAGAAWPQAAAPPPTSLGVQAPAQQSVPPQTEPAPPAREENPGLFNEIGKIFDRLPSLKSSQQTIEDLNTRAKDAARDASDSLSRLTKPSMVAGRMICPVSSNGAPDCKVGADKLCQAKGFKEGKSLNTDSAETCSAKVLIPGRTRKPDDCRTDNFVTSALCQ